MNLELEGQWALVTGSSQGLGRGIANSLLGEGANVILTARDPSRLEQTERDFTAAYGSERVLSFPVDLREEKPVRELAGKLAAKPGRVDHLVCNVGSGRSVPPLEEDLEEFNRMISINLSAAVNAVTALRGLLEKAAKAGGAPSITFIGSICGHEVLGCPVAYASAKAALVAYARNIARPMGRKGIRVNVVSPGNILFPGSSWETKLADHRETTEEMLAREVPLNRFGTVEEVADVVTFLASRRAGFVAGANWIVDGGQVRS